MDLRFFLLNKYMKKIHGWPGLYICIYIYTYTYLITEKEKKNPTLWWNSHLVPSKFSFGLNFIPELSKRSFHRFRPQSLVLGLVSS
jgi:hypothetical protein